MEIPQYIRVADICATPVECKAVMERFINAGQAYVLSRGPQGVMFMLIDGERTARVALQNGMMLPGKTMEALLRGILHHDGDMDMVLAEVALPEKVLTLATWTVREAPSEEAEPCYRTFMSSSDLQKILSFPMQREYEPYSDVYVVTSTTSLKQGVSLSRITIPVEIIYTVICPEGVKADPEMVRKGDRMTLTFTKPGFTSQSITLSAGSPSPFVKYDGAAILVSPLNSVGINFTRRIPVIVRSAKGRAVAGYSITVNGRPVNTSRPFIDLTERDLAPGNIVEIAVSSTNYQTLIVKLPAEKADVDTPLELVLQPERQGITLRLNFADGTMVEHELALERNDPRYRTLRGGSYCGFRAHLISNPGEPEQYNVEIKAGGKAIEVASSQPKAVRMEREAISSASDPSKSSQAGDKPADTPAEPTAETRKRRKSYVPKWVIFIGVVIAVAIAAYAVFFLPGLFARFGESHNVDNVVDVTGVVGDTISDDYVQPTEDMTSAQSEPATNSTIDPSVNSVANSEAQAASEVSTVSAGVASNPDATYLNRTKVWKRSELTSEEGRRVYDLLGNGDIDAILSDPYFRRDNSEANPTAMKIADLLWGAKNTPTQRANEVALRKTKGQPSIDLWSLYEALARVRPAEPNTGQRP